MRRRLRLRAGSSLVICAAYAAVVACVGEDPSPISASPLDAGADAVSDAPTDQHVEPDAPIVPRCDLTKDFAAPIRVPDLSTAGFDQGLSLTTDQLIAYVGVGAGQATISVRSRGTPTDTFGTATLLPGLTQGQIAFPSISADGTELIYVQNTGTAFDVYSATMSASGAHNASRVVNLNDPDASVNEWTPYLVRSGRALYFARAASFAGPYKIFRAERPALGGVFSQPQPAPGLGTFSSEQAPVVSDDELTIYFEGEPGDMPGGIYVATRGKTTESFGAPRRLDALNDPEAGSFPPFPSYLSADGCTLYLLSSRAPSASLDFWVASKPK